MMNLDDPKLTAFALDELDEPERSQIARAITKSPEAQRFVDETKEMARALKREFAAELKMEGRAPASPILEAVSQSSALQERSSNLSDIRDDPWFWSIGRPLAIAAVIAILAVIAGLQLLPRRTDSAFAVAERINLPPRTAPGEIQAEVQPEFSDSVAATLTDLSRTTKQPASGIPAKAKVGGAETVKRAFTESDMRVAAAAAQPMSAAPSLLAGLGAGRYRQDFNTATFDRIEENPFLDAKNNPLSTFSIDVDTASYSIVRRYLSENTLPPKDAVRVEEMLNYFTYDYPQPDDDKLFALHVDMASCPWESSHRLVRIGLKGKEIATDKRGPSNLVFLLDVSGSMMPVERLPLIKQSMRLLVDKLKENDRVAIVVYAGSSGLVLPATTGDHKEKILQALENLEAGGSTNGAEGIELAYRTAQENFIKGGVNRVILATDGDFNVGVTNQGDLIRLIEEKAKSGIFLSVLGVGTDNLKDSTMQKLADKGNGNYAYLDSLDEARKVLVQQMNGTLVAIAKDVKIQVEFNPARIGSYRLIGYEKRMLRKEDFNNDKVDAGEIGAGHTVTALYEVVPIGAAVDPAASVPPVDPLKYEAAQKPDGSGSSEMLTVKLRYKKPDGEKSELIDRPVTDSNAAFASASPDFKFAAAVAEFGMLLRESEHKGNGTFGSVLDWAQEGKGTDVHGYRAGFIELVRQAEALKKG
jgi:Ca-activated chloride channel family protein